MSTIDKSTSFWPYEHNSITNEPLHSWLQVRTLLHFAAAISPVTLVQNSCWQGRLHQECRQDILPAQQQYQLTGDSC